MLTPSAATVPPSPVLSLTEDPIAATVFSHTMSSYYITSTSMYMAYQDKYRLIVLLRRLLPSQSCSKKLIRKNPEFALTPGRPLLLSTPPRSTTVLRQFLTAWNNPHLIIVVCKIQLLLRKRFQNLRRE